MKRQILFLLPMVLLAACSNEGDPIVSPDSLDDTSLIKEMIVRFGNNVTKGSRATVGQVLLSEVTTKSYDVVDGKAVPSSRTQGGEGFTLSTVKFLRNGKSGYAIVSTDPRLQDVLFYTDNGDMADTTFIEPLRQTLNSIPQSYAETLAPLDSLYINPDSVIFNPPTPQIYPTIYPIVSTQWGQTAPYNLFAPACTCALCQQRGGHKPIGCVAVAVGQMMAKCGKFTSSDPVLQGVDWSVISNHATPTSSEQLIVGKFLGEIATGVHMNFQCAGSGASHSNVMNFLTSQGYVYESVLGPIELTKTYQSLSQGYPVLAEGFSSSGGHKWIVDGLCCVTLIGEELPKYHCNWGWNGQNDCWSLGNSYTIRRTGEQYSSFQKYLYVISF